MTPQKKMEKKPEIHPFSCGTQYLDWKEANCERCKKYNYDPNQSCDIDRALLFACFGSGTVTHEIGKRCGAIENENSFQWMCPEVEWTDEWKEEFLKRKACGV